MRASEVARANSLVVAWLVSLAIVAARHSRWVLVMGLALGLLFQDIAYLARPSIPFFIALLLLAASFRIGPDGLSGAVGKLKTHIILTLLCQLLLPLLLIAVFVLTGASGMFITALLLVAAAAPISGSLNLVIMLGHEPAAALRQLVVGTAFLPLTIIPVLLFLPSIGNVASIALVTFKLLLVIMGAAGVGILLRRLPRFKRLEPAEIDVIDGVSAILMALVVVGLMSAIGATFAESPSRLLLIFLFAFAVNFGFQWLGSFFWGRYFGDEFDVPMSVISGNRNIALYLTALPVSVTEPLLAFLGCYQFPMYLTPLLLRRFYQKRKS